MASSISNLDGLSCHMLIYFISKDEIMFVLQIVFGNDQSHKTHCLH